MHLGGTSNWVVFQKQNTTNQQRNVQQILVIRKYLYSLVDGGSVCLARS